MNTTKAKHLIEQFCQQHALPASYQTLAAEYFLPLADELANKSQRSSGPLLIGINGSQGSGKSTLAALLAKCLESLHGLSVCNLSIDDFYHTREKRTELAQNIHPLLKTRGVPGTHDIDLLKQTLSSLSSGQIPVSIPRFNKATDDRHTQAQWDTIDTTVDIIFLEGWCVGVSAQSAQALIKPCNELEQQEDADGQWRAFVNTSINQSLAPIFKQFDTLIMLKAPSFDCVFEWRQTQEEKLRQSLSAEADQSGVMDDQALLRFIQHYQRLTEHMLEVLPTQADIIFALNTQHDVYKRINNG